MSCPAQPPGRIGDRHRLGERKAERVAGRGLGGDAIEFLSHGGVNALGQACLGLVTLLARGGGRDRREGTYGEHLVDAGESVAEALEFMAAGPDEKVEAVAVGQLERLLPRVGRFDVEESERHVDITFVGTGIYPESYPQKGTKQCATMYRYEYVFQPMVLKLLAFCTGTFNDEKL